MKTIFELTLIRDIPIAFDLMSPFSGLQIGATNECGTTNTRISASLQVTKASGTAT
jgi:hypothetical protein